MASFVGVKFNRGSVGINLILFLLLMAVVVFSSLYIDVLKKNDLLKADIKRLESSQVLLMVPDEQAADIANWLTQHPEQTETIIEFAGRDKQSVDDKIDIDNAPKSVLLSPQPHVDNLAETNIQSPDNTSEKISEDVLVSENEHGVKVIRLPHGGIRVTTRELPQKNESQ
ncbi:membrane anchored protein in chemotaxis locus [Shewanella sp. ULN5]|nr:membrane anchored protein in chemotaxis locus [Shewanella sp. ULN5]MDP5144938.1 membrane anchored protein in chemotaxis locus [Shewanella sp. ULN5]